MDFFAETDLDTLLAALGDSVILDDDSAEGYACTGIFDAAFRLVELGGMGAESYAPAVTVKSSDVAAAEVVQGTAVSVAGKTCYVTQIQPERPDGKGLSVLILSEDAA